MATQTGFANLKVIGPIYIPNNSNTVIHTMQRSGLVFTTVDFTFNQLVVSDIASIYWRNNGTVETGEFNQFILWGNTRIGGGNEQNFHQAGGGFVPAGASIYQRNMRNGGEAVYVYFYILEFDTAVANFGSA